MRCDKGDQLRHNLELAAAAARPRKAIELKGTRVTVNPTIAWPSFGNLLSRFPPLKSSRKLMVTPKTSKKISSMAPKHEQKANSSGMSSTKTSVKEELVQARAVKRAERVEARRVQAEERKEAVRPYYLSCHPLRTTWYHRMTRSLIIAL